MVHYRNWIILATVGFTLIAFMPSAQAEPSLKEDNPGLPGCLAKVDQLEQIIADQNLTILRLQEQINDMQKYAPVPQTGQTVSYATGDDGALQKGVAWPIPRFVDNGNGTVTDKLTGLVWLKDANCFGIRSWFDALTDCNTLASGGCGLTDGSQAGEWRLANRKELESLMDFGYDTALPFRPPFVNFGWKYWTSTNSWFIESNGVVDATSKEVLWSVWPVRDASK